MSRLCVLVPELPCNAEGNQGALSPDPDPDPDPYLNQVAFFKVFRNKVGEWTVTQRAANPTEPSRLQALKDPLLPAMLPASVAP